MILPTLNEVKKRLCWFHSVRPADCASIDGSECLKFTDCLSHHTHVMGRLKLVHDLSGYNSRFISGMVMPLVGLVISIPGYCHNNKFIFLVDFYVGFFLLLLMTKNETTDGDSFVSYSK